MAEPTGNTSRPTLHFGIEGAVGLDHNDYGREIYLDNEDETQREYHNSALGGAGQIGFSFMAGSKKPSLGDSYKHSPVRAGLVLNLGTTAFQSRDTPGLIGLDYIEGEGEVNPDFLGVGADDENDTVVLSGGTERYSANRFYLSPRFRFDVMSQSSRSPFGLALEVGANFDIFRGGSAYVSYEGENDAFVASQGPAQIRVGANPVVGGRFYAGLPSQTGHTNSRFFLHGEVGSRNFSAIVPGTNSTAKRMPGGIQGRVMAGIQGNFELFGGNKGTPEDIGPTGPDQTQAIIDDFWGDWYPQHEDEILLCTGGRALEGLQAYHDTQIMRRSLPYASQIEGIETFIRGRNMISPGYVIQDDTGAPLSVPNPAGAYYSPSQGTLDINTVGEGRYLDMQTLETCVEENAANQ